jgi:hypothetical protein
MESLPLVAPSVSRSSMPSSDRALAVHEISKGIEMAVVP